MCIPVFMFHVDASAVSGEQGELFTAQDYSPVFICDKLHNEVYDTVELKKRMLIKESRIMNLDTD